MTQSPLISLIIPFYKGERFIGELLDSVFNEKYENLEVIIVNDESPTDTLKSLDPFRDKIKIFSQKNGGQASARNLGIRNASGSIIALLDQDDMWPPGRLSYTLSPLVDEGYDFVKGMTEMIFMQGGAIVSREEPTFRPELIGSALYRREVFEKVGLFDPNMRVGEDFDWNIRLTESGCKGKRISETTLVCRRHDKNLSDTKNFVKDGQFLSLRKKLERARLKKQV